MKHTAGSESTDPVRPVVGISDSQDRPWLGKKAWATGRITDSTKSTAIFSWIFACIWNVIAWPAVFAAMKDVGREPGLYFVLLFPAIGLVIAAWAIHLTRRWMKFGRSVFQLETLPGQVGGWIAGTIETMVPIVGDNGVKLALECVNRVTTGSGKSRHTSEAVLWKDDQLLTGRLPSLKAGGCAIPVAFQIPADATPTRDSSNNDIVWRLSANAVMSGADYSATFTVPVFEVAQTDETVPQAETIAAKLRSGEFAKAKVKPDLDVVTDAAGRMRFHFPASQRRGAAITVTMFLLLFGAITFTVVKFDGPMFFSIPAGLVTTILFYAMILLWFRDVELHVDRHGVQRFRRTLGFSTTYTIPSSEATAVRYRETSQVNGNSYYTVSIDTADGKIVSLISGLLQPDAKALAERVGNALGVKSGMEKSEPRR